MKRTILTSLAGSISALLIASGCSSSGNQAPQEPKLSGLKLSTANSSIQPGQNVTITGSLKNAGGPFKGLKISVQGSGVTNSVVAMPQSSQSKVENFFEARKDMAMASEHPSFLKPDAQTMEASLPNLECKGEVVNFSLVMQALKDGNADLHVTITPIESPKNFCDGWINVPIHKMNSPLAGS